MEGNIIITNIASLTIDDDEDDRISDLPDFIAHHILSFLVNYPKELIRTSVLSKRWFALTASSPILVFDEEGFLRGKYWSIPGVPHDPEYGKDMFYKYVEYTTSRFSQQQNVVSATKLNLVADLKDPAHADIVDRCLGLILKQGLQVFHIFNYGTYVCDNEQPPPMYRLPDKLLSLSSLTYLTIYHCNLPSSLMVDDNVVKFKSLKVLFLDGVYLNEEMIKHLTSGCPRLEEFEVRDCYGFKRLCVYGLQNLQNVAVFYTDAVEEIDIQAPNLLDVRLFHMGRRDKPPCVNLFSCQKLSMRFHGCFSEQFAVSLSNFPFLETLILKLSSKYKKINLSSHSLRKLSLQTQSDLDEIQINTPNLVYFQYNTKQTLQRRIRDSSESKTCMDCCPDFGADTSWFQKLRRYLDRRIRFKVLKLHILANLIDVEELKLLESSPFEVDHIELFVKSAGELSEYLSLVDAALWCCHPRSLALRSRSYIGDLERRDHLIKVRLYMLTLVEKRVIAFDDVSQFTYEKLLEQEDEGQTSIQIVFSTVKAFGRSNDHLITLLKEEVSQEA